MRAVVIDEDRRLVVVEQPRPAPAEGQALVEVAYCGICGSDLHFRDIPELFPQGTIPGHECSGRVVALGDGVPSWRLGERVTVLPFAQCGECELCASGQEQVCPHAIPNGVGLGTGRPGAYAEHVLVDERMLFALPDSVDDRAAALTEPLAVAVRAVARSGLDRGAPAMVLGAGTIGMLTALVLADRGYEQVVVVSRNAARRELATALGLTAVSLEEASAAARIAPACIFECAGTPAAARLAVELVGPLGRIMLVGLALEPLDLEAPPILFKEIELRGVISYSRADFAAAIDMLARGALPVDQLVTATVPLEEAEASFQELMAPGNRHLKILLAPQTPA
ncbi:MAG TPA: alcohol dehydrogenase catalytic domain-containing protein [Solirubrobacteraceae bacterium]|nr:alcohol dehydrogenase catalytic domain-containing protein [Solirubrobacteraceae bacterium]